MRLIVDRIEEGFAVCEKEDGSIKNVPLSLLPCGLREGAVLREADGSFLHDPEGEAERRERIEAKRRRLFQRK